MLNAQDADGLAHRPRDEGGHRQVQDARRADRHRGRRGRRLGRQRRRAKAATSRPASRASTRRPADHADREAAEPDRRQQLRPDAQRRLPNIAVGEGAVWARNPDSTLSRLDPDTGQAGRDDRRRRRQDRRRPGGRLGPQTARRSRGSTRARTGRGQTIHIGAESTAGDRGRRGLGLGDRGAAGRGVADRARAGRATRTIDVGAGVTYLAFGAGAVWTANYVDGTVSRIDPETNTVTARIPIGAAQALAAGAGSAWVSTAGGDPRRARCPHPSAASSSPAARKPDLLIASDLPLQGPTGAGAAGDRRRDPARTARRGFRAGRHTVGYRSCDDSTAQTGNYENRRCAANANAYANADGSSRVIGPYNSSARRVEIPMLNRAPGGPLAMISPSNTYPGLTRSGPGPPPAVPRRARRLLPDRRPQLLPAAAPATTCRARRMPYSRSGSASERLRHRRRRLRSGRARRRPVPPTREEARCWRSPARPPFDPTAKSQAALADARRALGSGRRGRRRRPVRRRRPAREGAARPPGARAPRSWAASCSRSRPTC